jgi:radical SAM protein with 4Fe4S-binding SPASM domain
MIKPDDKPRVSEGWRIRNDQTAVIAYKSSVERNIFKPLAPFIASLIPFFNGENTVTDLQTIGGRIYDSLTNGDNRELFTAILNDLLTIDDFLTLEGAKSPSLDKPYRYFIPDYQHYRFPPARLARPLSVQIAYTNHCVCNCRYCYAQRKNCREADLNAWRGLFDELAANEIYLVDIAGGDLFLRPDALAILSELAARDFVFFLSTKSHISEAVAAKLAELSIGLVNVPLYRKRRIQVSIDSTDEGVASYLVRHDGYFEQATASVKNLLKHGISPRVKCVLTSLNAAEPLKLIEFFGELGVDTFCFVYYSRSYYRHDDVLFLSVDQKKKLCELKAEIEARYPNFEIRMDFDDSDGMATKVSCERWEQRAVCSGGRSNLIIQPNGDVTLCDQIPHEQPYVVGNVFETGLINVWNSRQLLDFLYPDRERFQNSVCYDCELLQDCIGGKGYCYRDALFYYGSIYDAPPECPFQNKTLPRKT